MTTITARVEVRPAFLPLFQAPTRWSVVVAHRRAGKTVAALQRLISAALQPPKAHARYAFVAPLRNQAKGIAWDYLRRFLAPIPGVNFNEAELRADLPGNARITLFGSDNPDALRGQYLDGVVLDEYADQDPRVWDEIVRPLLADRKGWCVWIGTPRGPNAFARLYERATGNDWSRYLIRASESGILDADELEAAMRDMSEEAYAQEFECSFTAAVRGAYYGKAIELARAEGRIGVVPVDPAKPVETWWDLGVRDSMVIWFAQRIGAQIRLVDLLAGSGSGLDHYARELNARGYNYSRHIAPHDIQVRELGSGKSRLEIAADLGIRFEVAPSMSLEDGINATRMMLPRCWIDATKCQVGIEALQLYRAGYDEKARTFAARPIHDWTSHYADAMRTGAVAAETFGMPSQNRANPMRYIDMNRGNGWMGA